MVDVAAFLFNTGSMFWQSLLNDWGIIGLGLVSTFLIVRVANFIRRFFR